MLGMRWVLLATALMGASQAAPRPALPAGYVVHEKRDENRHSSWVKRSRIDSEAILPVRIGLIQNNLDKAHDLLMELSHPDSPKYGQWWSTEAVHDFFAPSAESVDMVKTWIQSVGIADSRIIHHDNKGWLAVDTTVQEAETLFATTFHEYEDTHLDEIRIGTDSYHIPQHLAAHIDYVTPGLKMVRVKKRTITTWKRDPKKRNADSVREIGQLSQTNTLLQGLQDLGGEAVGDAVNLIDQLSPTPQLDPSLRGCWYNMTVPCVRALYGLSDCPQAVEGNELGVFEMGDYFTQPSLDQYFHTWTPWVPNGTQPIPALINGAKYNTADNDSTIIGEALMDIIYAQALIYPQNLTVFQVDDPIYAHDQLFDLNNRTMVFDTFFDAIDGSFCTYSAFGQTGNDPNLDASYPNPDPAGYQGQLMCGVYKPTKVITISYGRPEYQLPANYQRRMCNEILKLSLMGTTVVAAVGDDGVAAFKSHPKPNGCLGPDHTIFNPSNLVTCPFVLAVGSTMLFSNQTVLDPESVMNYFDNSTNRNFTSAGGFSNLFERPDYQQDAVQHYLDNHVPQYPYYEQLEPNFSKVTGYYNRIGRAYPDVAVNGANYPIFFEGQQFFASGTSVSSPVMASILTLLNQERALIGKSSVGFVHQVFYSHPELFNDVTNGTNLGCGTNGFQAVEGWDAASGLGTPRYPQMRDLFLSLP